MGAAKKLKDKKVLQNLVPINALSAVHIEEISRKAVIEDIASRRYVFRKGDRDYQSVYLLEGKIELLGDGREVVSTVVAGSETARHPLAHKQPRQLSARAAGRVRIARIDSSLLDVLLTWDESAGYDVVEIDAEDNDDWMTRMLQSEAFLQLPPSNIHQLLMRLESVNAGAGEVIVRQGEDGDYFYIVKSGRLAVTRKASPRSKEVLLAELGEGACFGEEALVSGAKRNASVMMVTDGSLMRLSKKDFNELLRAPLVHEVDFDEARQLVSQGACWLDVRLPGEFDNQAIQGSRNLPLSALRDQCGELDRERSYILCCDTGRRSAAGAFVLSQRGFSVYTLRNGLMDVPAEALRGGLPADSVDEDSHDAEIIPFDNDDRSGSPASPGKAAVEDEGGDDDTLLIDKLAAAESDKLALQQQLQQSEAELAELQVQLDKLGTLLEENRRESQKVGDEVKTLQGELREREAVFEKRLEHSEQDRAALQAELERAQRSLEARQESHRRLEEEKKQLQEELQRLQQTLSGIQQSAEGRDEALRGELKQMSDRLERDRLEYEKRSAELEQELARVREDYQQLGQRTSTVAGERDAAVRELQQAQEAAAELQQQLDRRQDELGSEMAALKERLAQRERELEEQGTDREKLEQKITALSGEREQLRQQLEEAEQAADADRQKLALVETRLADSESRLAELEASLEQASASEASLRQQLQQTDEEVRGRLQAELETLERAREELEASLAAAHGDLEAGTAQQQSLREQLEAQQRSFEAEKGSLEARLAELEEDLKQRQEQIEQEQQQRRSMEQALADAEEALQASREREQRLQEELQASCGRAESEKAEFDEQLETLRSQIDEEQHQRALAEEARAAAEKALKEREDDEQRLAQQLAAAEKERERLASEFEEYREKSAALEKELSELQASREESAQRVAELESQLAAAEKEYESDIASVRTALSRAQDERDNLSREQARLMDAARRAEEKLEQARQDHETEIYRLRKELKESDGKAGAGLASELEAMHQQLQEAARQREDLEIKLGERSAQMEEAQVQLEKLEKQLQLARDSAREAEQQLVEANRAANDEMSARLDAEQRAQQALREELEGALAARNQSQEQLTVLEQELEELRAVASDAREAALTRQQLEAQQQQAEERLQQLQATLEQVRQERDQARLDEQEARREADQLRAEAEVTRGLVDMQAGAATSDEVLREELEQARKNIDVAVRLRSQAEAQVETLQREVERLRTELGGSTEFAPGVRIPSLDADDPNAAAVLDPEFVVDEAGEDEVQELPAPTNGTGEGNAAPPPAAPAGVRSWKGALLGLLVGAVSASGVFWYLNQRTGEGGHGAPSPVAAESPANPIPARSVIAETPSESAGRDHVSSAPATAAESFPVAPGVPEVPKAPATGEAQDGPSALAKDAGASDQPVSATAADSAADSGPSPASPSQPASRFRDPLSDGGAGPTMIGLHADRFAMGSGSASPYFDERPLHEVKLGRFAISKYEVTFEQYDRFARATGRVLPDDGGWGRGSQPVINVSWEDARAYADWLSGQTGHRYRLPTEAEWEFAARSGSERRFPWGSEVGAGHANCFDCGSDWSGERPAPVGSFAPTAWGLNDMTGNVMEWVQDCYREGYQDAPTDGSAVDEAACAMRVVRGGSYASPAETLRSAARARRSPDSRLDDLGFRVVREF